MKAIIDIPCVEGHSVLHRTEIIKKSKIHSFRKSVFGGYYVINSVVRSGTSFS